MKHFGYILFLFPLIASAMNDAYLVESKVQGDLENALSRLIPKEEFLVQVNAEVQVKSERKLVEGETIISQVEREEETTVPPMPGFVPEIKEERSKDKPTQSRQVYRTVDSSELAALRVYVKFDDALKPATITQAKNAVQEYLRGSYSNKAFVSYSELPMLKPERKPAKSEAEVLMEKMQVELEKLKEKTPPTLMEQVWQYVKWIGAAVLGAIAMMLLIQRESQKNGNADTSLRNLLPFMHPHEVAKSQSFQKSQSKESTEESAAELRQRLLAKFLSRSEAFKNYHDVLNTDLRMELYAGLQGPAFDSLLDGVRVTRPLKLIEPPDLDQKLQRHEKNFDEYVRAQDWKSGQFFGFMHYLTDEQINAIAQQQTPRTVCVLLRFMRPEQSAKILKTLTDKQKSEVLAYSSKLNQIPFSELVEIEQQVRKISNQLPKNIFGASKDEADFWGNILSEADDQDSILRIIEREKPDLYPSLKKYRFALEDAASLPDSILEKVLVNVDNDELCLALSTCSKDVADVLLDALSPKRREHLLDQLQGYKESDKEKTNAAKIILTKKIREAIA